MAGHKKDISTQPLLLRIARANARARKQLAWLIVISAGGGALLAGGTMFLLNELAHTEIFAFIDLALTDPGTTFSFPREIAYALAERMPALPLGIALACAVGILAVVRYFFRYRHTFRRTIPGFPKA